jgi:hypothetical protein
MKIRPQNSRRNAFDRMKHVVVIIPIDSEINEAENVTQEYGDERPERFESLTVRNLQFEDHYRYDDRKNTIAERFKPVSTHSGNLLR